MNDEELIATLFVNDVGEVKSFPEHAGQEVVYHPVLALPEFAQKAIVRLYRERAEARLLAIEWYHEWANGPAVGAYSETARSLVEKTWRLERAVDKEMEHG